MFQLSQYPVEQISQNFQKNAGITSGKGRNDAK